MYLNLNTEIRRNVARSFGENELKISVVNFMFVFVFNICIFLDRCRISGERGTTFCQNSCKTSLINFLE